MTNEVEYWTERLIKEVVLLGHPAEFGRLLAANLGSEKSIRRLALYVAHNQPASAEDIADEMLASAMNETHGAVKRKLNITAKK